MTREGLLRWVLVTVICIVALCLCVRGEEIEEVVPARVENVGEGSPRGEGVVRGQVDPSGTSWNSEVQLKGKDQRVWYGSIRADGFFALEHVPDGMYILRVIKTTKYYLKVSLEIQNGHVIHAAEIDAVQKVTPLKTPTNLRLEARLPIPFFAERPALQIRSMLRSPFAIAAVIALVGVVVFPKFLDSLDDEMLEDIPCLFPPARHVLRLRAHQELTGERRPEFKSPNDMFQTLAETTS